MKYSIFNSVIDLSAKTTLIYNSFTDKYMFLRKGIVEYGTLPSQSSPLFQQLLESGMVVDDDVDEMFDYLNYAKSIEVGEGTYQLIINPTIDCNFRCWYCYEKHTRSQMSELVLEKVKKLIGQKLSAGVFLQMSFFGGEPLMYYKQVILPLLEYVSMITNGQKDRYAVNMTTNGYLLSENRITELKKYNFNGAQITLDGNKALHDRVRFSADKMGSYDRIVENIKILAVNEIPVTLRLNCTDENISSMSQIANSFSGLSQEEKNYIHVDAHVVWQEKNSSRMESDMDNVVRTFMNIGIQAAKRSFRNYCYADRRNSCMINYNGDIYKCTAVDFENTNRDGYLNDLGEIIWENDSLEKRMSVKFKNKPCLSCRIYPLCHGGCTTNILRENGKEYCRYGFDENKKNQVVLDTVVRNVQLNRTWKKVVFKV